MKRKDDMENSIKLLVPEGSDIREGIFKDIVSKLYETYKKKNADYGNSFAKIFAKRGMTYALGHIEEKLERVDALQSKPNQVNGESFMDSLEDMANYAILTLIELRLRENTSSEEKK